MIGIVVLNYNEYKQTIEFIEHVKRLKLDYLMVIVDNYSANDSLVQLKKYQSENCVILDSGINGGYSFGNNVGLKWLRENSKVKYAVVANPDTFFDEKYIDKIVHVFETNPSIGLLTGIMLNKDGTVVDNQYWDCPGYKDDLLKCFLLLNKIKNAKKRIIKKHNGIIYQVPAGSCEVVRMSAMEKVEYFDDKVFLFYEENIITKRLERKGYKVGVLDNASYYHLHSTTINKNMTIIKKYKIYLKSMYYYECEYNNCHGIKKLLLKLAINYAKLEFTLFTYLKPRGE